MVSCCVTQNPYDVTIIRQFQLARSVDNLLADVMDEIAAAFEDIILTTTGGRYSCYVIDHSISHNDCHRSPDWVGVDALVEADYL